MWCIIRRIQNDYDEEYYNNHFKILEKLLDNHDFNEASLVIKHSDLHIFHKKKYMKHIQSYKTAC